MCSPTGGTTWGHTIATNLGEVIVKFGADVSPFSGGINTMIGMLGSWQGAAVMAAAAVELALAKVVVDAAKMAADFQGSMTQLAANTGDTTDNMKQMGQGILDLSSNTTATAGQLVDAMTPILSHGQRGAQAMDTLTQSTKLAQVAGGDYKETANTVALAMYNYSKSHLTATQATNGLMYAAQQSGVTLAQHDKAMADIIPTASALGIKYADLNAALSVSERRTGNAAASATYLTNMFNALEKNSTQTAKGLKSVGLTADQVRKAMGTDLAGGVKLVSDAIKAHTHNQDEYNRVLAQIFPNIRAYKGFLDLTGVSQKDFTDTVKGTNDAMNKGKGVNDAFQKSQQNVNNMVKELKNTWDAFMVMLGQQLLPLIQQFLNFVTPIAKSILDWAKQGDNLRNVLITIGILLAPLILVVGTLGLVFVQIGVLIFFFVNNVVPALIAAFNWVKDRVASLGNFLPWLGQQFSNLGSWVQGVLTNLKNFVGNIFDAIGTFIHVYMVYAQHAVENAFSNMYSAVSNKVGDIIGAVGTIPGRIAGILGNLASQAFTWGSNLIGGFVSGITSMIGNVVNAASSVAGAVASHLSIHSPAEKGPMSDADKWAPNLMAMMTAGIYAGIPDFNKALMQVGANGIGMPSGSGVIGAGGKAGTNIYLMVDGRELANAIGKQQAAEIRLQLGVK